MSVLAIVLIIMGAIAFLGPLAAPLVGRFCGTNDRMRQQANSDSLKWAVQIDLEGQTVAADRIAKIMASGLTAQELFRGTNGECQLAPVALTRLDFIYGAFRDLSDEDVRGILLVSGDYLSAQSDARLYDALLRSKGHESV